MQNRLAIVALITAGSLWGLTVALSKLTFGWLDPSWLATLRFLAATPVVALIGRRRLRTGLHPKVLASGAVGFGAVMLLQNAGIARTSVSHAAIIVGAVPVIVAVISAGARRGRPGALAWVGYAVSLLGIVLVARGTGGGATALGDLLVFGSVVLSAVFIALQPTVLQGRDPAAVTAAQFAAGAVVALPVSVAQSGLPTTPGAPGPVLAFVALVLVGTVLPFWLFAHGQARIRADVAGAFVNLEPLVGAAVGWMAFGDPFGPWQLIGVAAVIGGILLSALPRSALVDSVVARWA